MQAGRLDRVITFRRKSVAYDGLNEAIPTWADAFTVWAQIMTEDGREFFAAQKKNAETTVVFRVRYNATINETMRIKYDNRTYEIIPPINNKNAKHRELLVSAKEVI